MSLESPYVLCTDNGDGSANFTVAFADDDHKFSVSGTDGGYAEVSYEETLSWRGEIRVSEPDESVYKELMQSEEMTEFLDNNGFEGVRRGRR